MKKPLRLLALLGFYATMVLLFAVAKLCFVVAQPAAVRGEVSAAELAQIVWHGLPLDLATTGYAAAPLWLLLGLSVWMHIRGLQRVYRMYAALLAALLAVIAVADTCLYGFWGIKLDGTVWNYLSQPGGALASVSMSYALTVTLTTVVAGVAVYYVLRCIVPRQLPPCPHRLWATGLWLSLIHI